MGCALVPGMTAYDTRAPHPRLFVRWFVQYNPMFTASALCVLGGVLLSSRALGPDADVGLTAVLELYQWLVIGVAALLYRRLLERRPAAILGVIALVLLVDPTLQLSALATAGQTAATVLWVGLFAAKATALAWAFRLRVSWAARALPIGGALVTAALPTARVMGAGDDVLPAALAVAVFLLGLVAAFGAPRVTSARALGAVGAEMFPRLVRAAAAIGIGGVVYQAWNATLQLGLHALMPALGAAAFVGAAAAPATREARTWTLVVVGGVLCTISGGSATAHGAVMAGLAAVALLLAARAHAPRVFVGGVMAGALAAALSLHATAASSLADAPGLVAVGVIATVGLALVLWRRRAWSAIPALLALHAR